MRKNAREKRSRDRRSPGQSWLLYLVTNTLPGDLVSGTML